MRIDPGDGAAAFQGISDAVGGIQLAAAEGFAISENGGQPLLNAIQELQEQVRTALSQSHRLEMQPALGATPNATVYKPFLATIASDPTQGAVPVLKKLQEELTSAHSSIQQAMNNYRATDEGSASNVNSAGTWT
ncbi:MAG TPA: hypothetical protein VFX70_08355 [Mycobacteriales bacterium]|nr:hypothetical protein [Mycobacteriales bacterium]